LGASRTRLIGQLLTESIVLSLLGGGIGILLAAAGLLVIASLVPGVLNVVKQAQLNGWVISFTVGTCFVVGVLCGLLPALQTLKQDLHGTLKESGRTVSAARSHRTRSILVVSEIALALIPLVGAGLLIRSFYRLLEVSPGFATQHV